MDQLVGIHTGKSGALNKFVNLIVAALVCVVVASCNHTRPVTSQNNTESKVAEDNLVLSVKGKDFRVGLPVGYCDRTDGT
jgi:hypothetical protein